MVWSIYVHKTSQTLNDAMTKGFDIANTESSESSPVENRLAKVSFTAVRIQKGESVTVEYTERRSRIISFLRIFTRSTMFVKDADYTKKDTFTDSDRITLNKIRYTVRNDGSISSDGDLIAFFIDDTAVFLFTSVSPTWSSPEGSNRFKRRTLVSSRYYDTTEGFWIVNEAHVRP